MVDQDVLTVGPQVSDRPDGRPRWMPFDGFPFANRYARIDGHRIHYVDEGAGPPLLLAYDGVEAFLWRDVILRLREAFRCVAVDLPGTGGSTSVEGLQPNPVGAADVLGSLVRRLDLRDITVVASGVGGSVSLAMAARSAERIRAIVAVETFWGPRSEEGPRTANPRREAARAVGHLGGVDRSLRTIPRCVPVLLVFGAESPAVREGAPERWRERFPDAELLLVDGGHDVPMARDPDLVARALTGWWKEEVGRP
ncbi:MAG TPA: alpha/beta fold hydrolase [Actinomycetota bacterium]|nr:alpha/beta fold hydrolase [Actinomycetota bacterium]